jgi:RimJ/RimL family protein N-acetyltransferase
VVAEVSKLTPTPTYSLETYSEIGEDLVATAYLRLKAEGLLPIVFYQGPISLAGFLDWYRNPTSKFLGCFARPDLDKSKLELCGLGWIQSISTVGGVKRGETGMVFFRNWQSHGYPREWTRQMLDFSFGPLGMDYLYGTTPEENVVAVRFSRQMGFRQFGPIPGYCNWNGQPSGAIISAMSKEEWRNGRK